ncbi:MBL fold metallo-hydrolase [Pseudomonas sp. TTU2014-080ASC]|uniref:MBL fold metallo-hydrolase n=1 Tax=Pseudomonas sp. TTU2014-080ASC TaxID=1729724 RepID=UPI000718957D|nr:MBL fold metallo-hydrolase [Pseudomonas sp. TTU2014-080ASC]KRW57528.1 MBL fold metallo-hydrolase [Pseudomonas sp. TTU2014-080ASC]
MHATSATQPLRSLFLAMSLGICSALGSTAALAAPAAQTEQVPGYFRLAIGDATVTALYDGYVELAPSLLKGMEGKEIEKLLARSFQKTDPGFQTAVNAYLVHTRDNLVLVDAGAAKCFGPTLGNIVQNIEAAGYKPSDVDTILVTHMHPDHLCGVTSAEGKAAFPNASLWAAQADADFWLSEKVAAAAPEAAKGLYQMAKAAVQPYKDAGKYHTFKQGDALVPGLSVVPTPGHTPGHTSFLLQSAEQSLLLWGDIIHSHAVQMQHPEVSMEFDVDSTQAIKTRKELLKKVADNGWWIAGAHLPFPGIGHVRSEQNGYAWVPAEYGPLR